MSAHHRVLDTMIDTDDYYLIPQRVRLLDFFETPAASEHRARHHRRTVLDVPKGAA
jgi:hypothetical protein